MKRFVALLLIAITVALPYSYAFCAENSANYIVPNTISAKTLDDYNGIWHAKYCLINDMVFSFDDYFDLIKSNMDEYQLGERTIKVSDLTEDSYLIASDGVFVTVWGSVVEASQGLEFINGEIIEKDERTGIESTFELLSDGNLREQGVTDGITVSIIYEKGNYSNSINGKALEESLLPQLTSMTDKDLMALRTEIDRIIAIRDKGDLIYDKDGIQIKWMGFDNSIDSMFKLILLVTNPYDRPVYFDIEKAAFNGVQLSFSNGFGYEIESGLTFVTSTCNCWLFDIEALSIVNMTLADISDVFIQFSFSNERNGESFFEDTIRFAIK